MKFSKSPAMGINTIIRRKYEIEATCPMIMYGSSTGCPPIQVRISRLAVRIQKSVWEIGRNIMLRWLDVCRSGMASRIRIDASSASTPPSLLGIDRRMAYAKRKYHSGLICGGVLSGLAGEKLSGSLSMSGENRVRRRRINSMSISPSASLIV